MSDPAITITGPYENSIDLPANFAVIKSARQQKVISSIEDIFQSLVAHTLLSTMPVYVTVSGSYLILERTRITNYINI